MAGAIKRGTTDLEAGLHVDAALGVTLAFGDGTGAQVALTLQEAYRIGHMLIGLAQHWQAVAEDAETAAIVTVN